MTPHALALGERVHLVGSGALGCGLSDPYDCNVYLIDAGDSAVLVDAGAGLAPDRLLELIRSAGPTPGEISHLVLTHAHGDHAGGAAGLVARLGRAQVAASPLTAEILRNGDERRASVDVARAAGVYPPDFRLPPCPVSDSLTPGGELYVGDLTLRALETPGHCDGHLSLLARIGKRTLLFAGDAVFPGGRIQLQAIDDCRIPETVRTLRALRELEIDELYAGHGAPVLSDAQRHVEAANRALDELRLPPQMSP